MQQCCSGAWNTDPQEVRLRHKTAPR
jgi:hypothetical protein